MSTNEEPRLFELLHSGWAVVIGQFSDHADGYLMQPKIHRTADEATARRIADQHRDHARGVVCCVVPADSPVLYRRKANATA
jgi:hypothetical protein